MILTPEIQNQTKEQIEVTTRAMQKLQFIIGEWHGDGESQGKVVTGKDIYEWLNGHFFIMHSWHWDMGGMDFSGKEIIGYNSLLGNYFSSMFDNAGHFVNYEITLDDKFMLYNGRLQKAQFEFKENDFEVDWQFSSDEKHWSELCAMKFSRIQ